jgi:hypothetical protein
VLLLIVFLVLLAGQLALLTSRGTTEIPVVKEGILNTPCRAKRQRAIIEFLRRNYDGRRVLVASGKWPCVMPEVGIYFRDTITDQTRKYWTRMHTEPGKWIEWIIRGGGDPIDDLMRAYPRAFQDFEVVEQGEYPGEGSFTIYRRRETEIRDTGYGTRPNPTP